MGDVVYFQQKQAYRWLTVTFLTVRVPGFRRPARFELTPDAHTIGEVGHVVAIPADPATVPVSARRRFRRQWWTFGVVQSDGGIHPIPTWREAAIACLRAEARAYLEIARRNAAVIPSDARAGDRERADEALGEVETYAEKMQMTEWEYIPLLWDWLENIRDGTHCVLDVASRYGTAEVASCSPAR